MFFRKFPWGWHCRPVVWEGGRGFGWVHTEQCHSANTRLHSHATQSHSLKFITSKHTAAWGLWYWCVGNCLANDYVKHTVFHAKVTHRATWVGHTQNTTFQHKPSGSNMWQKQSQGLQEACTSPPHIERRNFALNASVQQQLVPCASRFPVIPAFCSTFCAVLVPVNVDPGFLWLHVFPLWFIWRKGALKAIPTLFTFLLSAEYFPFFVSRKTFCW